MVIALASLGCSGSIASLPYDAADRCLPCASDACAEPLELTFLGVGGFVLERGKDTIVIDPFFSNPSVATVAFGTVSSNVEGVRRWMPYLPNASALLVGHAHYDHLLDVPTVAKEKTKNAKVAQFRQSTRRTSSVSRSCRASTRRNSPSPSRAP